MNRIITPIINQPTIDIDPPTIPGAPPELDPGYTFGLGDINPQFYFVPKNTGNITVGFGPQFSLPTATTNATGSGKCGIGPVGVIAWTQGKWVIGALASQLWSFAGDSDRNDVSQFLLQPFVTTTCPTGGISPPVLKLPRTGWQNLVSSGRCLWGVGLANYLKSEINQSILVCKPMPMSSSQKTDSIGYFGSRFNSCIQRAASSRGMLWNI